MLNATHFYLDQDTVDTAWVCPNPMPTQLNSCCGVIFHTRIELSLEELKRIVLLIILFDNDKPVTIISSSNLCFPNISY